MSPKLNKMFSDSPATKHFFKIIKDIVWLVFYCFLFRYLLGKTTQIITIFAILSILEIILSFIVSIPFKIRQIYFRLYYYYKYILIGYTIAFYVYNHTENLVYGIISFIIYYMLLEIYRKIRKLSYNKKKYQEYLHKAEEYNQIQEKLSYLQNALNLVSKKKVHIPSNELNALKEKIQYYQGLTQSICEEHQEVCAYWKKLIINNQFDLLQTQIDPKLVQYREKGFYKEAKQTEKILTQARSKEIILIKIENLIKTAQKCQDIQVENQTLLEAQKALEEIPSEYLSQQDEKLVKPHINNQILKLKSLNDEANHLFSQLELLFDEQKYETLYSKAKNSASELYSKGLKEWAINFDNLASKAQINNNALKTAEIYLQNAKNGSVAEAFIQISSLLIDLNSKLSENVLTQIENIKNQIQKQKNIIENGLSRRYPEVTELLKAQKYTQALIILKELKTDAEKINLSEMVSEIVEKINNAERIQQFNDLMGSSSRIKLDDVGYVLGLERREIVKFILKNKQMFEGTHIDGDYIIIEKKQGVGAFVNMLDDQFDDWESKELSKEGKIK